MTLRIVDGSGERPIVEFVRYYEYRDEAGKAREVHADFVDTDSSGALIFWNIYEDGEERIVMAVAGGHWVDVVECEEPKE